MTCRKTLIEAARLLVKVALTILVGLLFLLHAMKLIVIDAAALILVFLIIALWIESRVYHAVWERLSEVEILGNKITLAEVEAQQAKLDSVGLISPHEDVAPPYLQVAGSDPNLALAGLRIEIERELRQIAEKHALLTDRVISVGQLARLLAEHQLLTREESSALNDLAGTLNRAVHGAEVSPRAAEWALEVGPGIVSALKKRH